MTSLPAQTAEQKGPARIAAIYAIVAALWILLSDLAVGLLFDDPRLLAMASAIKGWVFVAFTSFLLFGLMRRMVMALERSYSRTLEEQNEKLRALALLRVVSQQSTDAIYVKDADGRYLLFNEAAARFVGKSSDDVIGQDDRAIFPPNDAEILMENDRKIMQSGVIQTIEEHLTTALGMRIFLATKGPLFDPDGNLCGLFGIARDVTDRLMAEDDLRTKNQLLEQSNADLEQFAYVASHDLQTPLRNMVSYAQLLSHRYRGRLGTDADEFIDFIVHHGKQMSLLINDLLDYARITGVPCGMVPVDMQRLVKQVVRLLESEIHVSGAIIEYQDLPIVLGDPTLLSSLMQNLLENGMRYRANSRPPILKISSEFVDGNKWKISVCDNGIGIDSIYFDKIFEMFQRLTPDHSDNVGTGIGLTICRRIMNRLEGSIWVDSVVGEGSCFHFVLSAPSVTMTDGG